METTPGLSDCRTVEEDCDVCSAQRLSMLGQKLLSQDDLDRRIDLLRLETQLATKSRCATQHRHRHAAYFRKPKSVPFSSLAPSASAKFVERRAVREPAAQSIAASGRMRGSNSSGKDRRCESPLPRGSASHPQACRLSHSAALFAGTPLFMALLFWPVAIIRFVEII